MSVFDTIVKLKYQFKVKLNTIDFLTRVWNNNCLQISLQKAFVIEKSLSDKIEIIGEDNYWFEALIIWTRLAYFVFAFFRFKKKIIRDRKTDELKTSNF